MESTEYTPLNSRKQRSKFWDMAAIAGLQFAESAASGFMSPILPILMTEYFAKAHTGGLPIDCGANSSDEACAAGSRQAAWLFSIYSAAGSFCSFILSPMLGQASDLYGRKPFLVLSEVVRVGMPFSVMYFMYPRGSITPYLLLSLADSGFGTSGVMSAAMSDVVAREGRAAAFGYIVACDSVGYCLSAFIAPFFSREHILQIAVILFLMRVLWAMFVLRETLPSRPPRNKARWITVGNPFGSISILFRDRLFVRLTILIALTSLVSTGIFQVQTFFLNTVVAFNVQDFGNLMLLGGVVAVVTQGFLLEPLVNCMKEKGVIILALVSGMIGTSQLAASAYYPHKWLVFTMTAPSALSGLAFPAISALKSMHASEKEQGRLQGAIYGAKAVFEAIGPVIFSSLYAAMTRQSVWSQAFPFVVASVVYFVGFVVALWLPTTNAFPSRENIDAVLSPVYGEAPRPNRYKDVDDEYSQCEPLLGIP